MEFNYRSKELIEIWIVSWIITSNRHHSRIMDKPITHLILTFLIIH